MKIRLLDQSLRIRISKTELDTLADGADVIAITDFGFKSIQFVLKKTDTSGIVLTESQRAICLGIPINYVNRMHTSNKVGFQQRILLSNNLYLNCKIEKDYKCLTERNEDESDLFINPNKGHKNS